MSNNEQAFTPHDVQPVYASGTEVNLKPSDITILFKREIFGVGGNSRQVYEQVAAGVTLSPVAAKSLAQLLTRVISDYEQHVGPIPDKGTKVRREGDVSDLENK